MGGTEQWKGMCLGDFLSSTYGSLFQSGIRAAVIFYFPVISSSSCCMNTPPLFESFCTFPMYVSLSLFA